MKIIYDEDCSNCENYTYIAREYGFGPVFHDGCIIHGIDDHPSADCCDDFVPSDCYVKNSYLDICDSGFKI